jgi:hypothetical protein
MYRTEDSKRAGRYERYGNNGIASVSASASKITDMYSAVGRDKGIVRVSTFFFLYVELYRV